MTPTSSLSRSSQATVSTRCSGSHSDLAVAARIVGGTKIYGSGQAEVRALNGVHVDFEAGRFTSIMGPSGSGKSTLMHCMAGLDRLTKGHSFIAETALGRLSERELTALRRSKLGFVFQSFNLLPALTAEENILLPLSVSGLEPDPAVFSDVIDVLGLGGRLHHRPTDLSGGQQQRVAIARALVGQPDVVFADEPTGNLDSTTGAEILGFLRDAVDARAQTIAMVTHDPVAAAWSDRVVFLVDGQVSHELRDPTAESVLDVMKQLGR